MTKNLLKKQVSIFITSHCTNDCLICGIKGPPNFNFHHLAQTKEEEKGLINLFKIFSPEETLSLTGGDPLRNDKFLDLFTKHGQCKKQIIINPLTFFSLELNKPAKKITEKEMIAVLDKIKNKGFCKDINKIIDYLTYFDYIDLSRGNLQCPSPKLSSLSKKIWDRYISPRIINNTKSIHSFIFGTGTQTISGRFKNRKLKSYPASLVCVGNARKSIKGKRKPNKIQIKRKSCEWDPVLYFNKRAEGTNLFLLPCCAVGVNPYVAYKTSLTLGKMAKMKTKELKKYFKREKNKMGKNAFYLLLTKRNYNKNFQKYISFAEKLLKEKTGKTLDILANTYSFRKKCCPCEVCNTIGVMLHQAGITVEEWHDYLEKRSPFQNRSKNF